MVVTNDLIVALDRKQDCAALFLDLSKVFDSVDHELLLNKLRNAGFGPKAVKWLRNYYIVRTQCVHAEGHKSDFLEITKGVLQGSILGPILFSTFINDLGKDIQAKMHFYADDTVIYMHAPSIEQRASDCFSVITNCFLLRKPCAWSSQKLT